MSFRNSIPSQRKDIWENYPVSLNPLGKGHDGAERHAVIWNRKRLLTMRSKLNNMEDWYTYEKNMEILLLQVLQRSTSWIVEPSNALNQICILRMVYGKAQSKNQTIPDIHSNVPVLTCLNDIKAFFPAVIWHMKDIGTKKIYSIELSSKKLKEYSQGMGRDVTQEITNRLVQALQSSTAWNILPAKDPNEICLIAFAKGEVV